MPDLKVAFWNVKNLFDVNPGDSRAPTSAAELTARIGMTANVLNGLFQGAGPDLIGLAEVQNSTILDALVAQLAAPYHVLWEPCRNTHHAHPGLAVLARKERCAAPERAGAYSPHAFARPRYLIARCRLLEQSEAFFFVVNHWRSKIKIAGSDDAQDRMETGQALGTWLADAPADTCAVVVGDFNAEPFEKPFGQFGIRAIRHFGPLRHPRLYNTAWRFLPEPDPCEDFLAAGYRAEQTKTTFDAYDSKGGALSVVFDQLLVSRRAIVDGPITLRERSVAYAFDAGIGYHLPDGHRRPAAWRYNAGAPTGASDHFPLIAEFVVRTEKQP
jgi:hypothetical protein